MRMDMSFRIDSFPTTADEAAGMAAAIDICGAPSLVSFVEWADDLIVVGQVTGSSACPCHTTRAPWSVAEMVRLSLVRFDDSDPEREYEAGVALCGFQDGLQVAAELQGKLKHSLVVRDNRWHDLTGRSKGPKRGRAVISRPCRSWSGTANVSHR